jgi:hypothetical protein
MASLRGTMNKLYYPASIHLPGRDGPPTDLDESRTDIAVVQSSQHLPLSASTLPTLDNSSRAREAAESAAGTVVTQLLGMLVVALVVTSILGFTLFDRQGGNSTTAIVSLVMGGSAAVLGLIFGFREAHRVS